MAREIRYWQDNDPRLFVDGPFVVVDTFGGFRVEAEFKNHNTTVLPDRSVANLVNKDLLYTRVRREAHKCADCLNALVREGEIILKGNCWVSKED